jgi:hypothetical protein
MTMKNTLLPSKPSRGTRHRARRPSQPSRPRHGDCHDEEFSLRTDRSRIQWPTAQELQQVATTLAKVSRTGMRQESAGDYFTSGDLAYQIQEILRATDALLKKSRRFNS